MLKTVHQALEILKMFTKEKPVWGGRELSNATGINHTKIYRILETLEAQNFLTKDAETKKYSLGFAVWELGSIMYDQLNVKELIRPSLARLTEKTGESTFLTILDGKEALTLEVVEPANKVKFSVSAGSRAPLYVGASYRSILAYMPDEAIEEVIAGGLKAYTDRTMTSEIELRNELATIRKRGFAISHGEYTEDVIALAMPLFHEGRIVGSITISGPAYRFNEERFDSCLPLLREAITDISEKMERYQIVLK
ncbi:IclR family transcriptional regulator [Shouchella clausii]|uniref:IclR family transcriptional regulator n=1 Tax=Shouchella clausii TaxID=79880 RepID=UPI000BA6715D|nr:IclR family transcriptional regulator [Shouchella clausii]PAD92508.1 IclR family transcriptional regulator [Shouchella clausii]